MTRFLFFEKLNRYKVSTLKKIIAIQYKFENKTRVAAVETKAISTMRIDKTPNDINPDNKVKVDKNLFNNLTP